MQFSSKHSMTGAVKLLTLFVLAGGPATVAKSDAPGRHPSGLSLAVPSTVVGQWLPSVLTPVTSHSAIYDPVGNRMIKFGGQDGQFKNDTWSLSLSDPVEWVQLVPSGMPPPARSSHSAVYDPVRHRMIVFGGEVGSGPGGDRNDVWALSLSDPMTWTELSPSGPLPPVRASHCAVYDAVGDRMIVVGGSNVVGRRNDTWALSLAGGGVWSEMLPSGTLPDARQGHASIYDPIRQRIVVFGGFDGTALRNDTWELSLTGGSAWSELTPTGGPPSPRYNATARYDPIRDRIVVMGGSGGGQLDDTWELSLSGAPVWAEILPQGTPPSGRSSHTSVYDVASDRLIVFAGTDGWTRLNDVWALSLASPPAWSELSATSPLPSARTGHAAVYDYNSDRMIVFGGFSISYYPDDVWALSLSGPLKWSQLSPAGTPPQGRSQHTAIYDPILDRMVIYGGWNGTELGDVWALSLSGTPTWEQLSPLGELPAERSGHSAIYDWKMNRMVVFGGNVPGHVNDTWELSFNGPPQWSELLPNGGLPAGRTGHSAVYDSLRNRMVVFGGFRDGASLQETWELDLTGTPGWTYVVPGGASPPHRNSHSAVYDPIRDRMVVFGGEDGGYQDDAWALSLMDPMAWSELHPTGSSPKARYDHTAIYEWKHDVMVVFGGLGNGYYNDSWALVWGQTPTAIRDSKNLAYNGHLFPPFPNPFNPRTTVYFELLQRERVSLKIYDVSGALVTVLVDESRPRGLHSVEWDGSDSAGHPVSSGVYFFQLLTRSLVSNQKAILLK